MFVLPVCDDGVQPRGAVGFPLGSTPGNRVRVPGDGARRTNPGNSGTLETQNLLVWYDFYTNRFID